MATIDLDLPFTLPSAPLWRPLGNRPQTYVGADLIQNTAYYNGNTYIGYSDGSATNNTAYSTAGAIKVMSVNKATGAVTTSPVIKSGIYADQHSTPSVLVRQSDHKLLVAVADVLSAHIWVALSTNAEDVTAWGAATDIGSTFSLSAYQYACLFQLSAESGKIYLFFTNGQPNSTMSLYFATSTDGGSTWSAATQLWSVTNKAAYFAISSNDVDRIDVAICDGVVVQSETGSIYHFYYDGTWRNSAGTSLGSTPFSNATTNMTKVYDGATNGSVRVPYGITVGPNPAIVWSAGAVSNPLTTPMNYWYGVSSGGSWTVNQITSETTTPDPRVWEGGITIDPTNSNKVFLSKGGDIYQYTTANSGVSWSSSQITTDGTYGPNQRPLGIRNADPSLTTIFEYGPFPYDGQCCQIRGFPAFASSGGGGGAASTAVVSSSIPQLLIVTDNIF